jgi:branched-subunit amino acid transport protein
MNSFWLTMFVVGILTFGIRLSFILLFDRWTPPRLLQQALRFVPIAVLSAIIAPELLIRHGAADFSPNNLRLVAGIVAMLVAWKTKNIVWTILAGMGMLLGLQYLR